MILNKPYGIGDRVSGIILGLAAGDRIGGPIRMALRLAESLRDNNSFNPEDIGQRYLQWWSEGAFDTGPVVAQVMEFVTTSGMPFEQAAVIVDQARQGKTAGCNPAHRSAPLAMLASLQDSQLSQAAITEARLTHHNPIAGDVAAAVVILCRSLIRGEPWEIAFSVIAKVTEEVGLAIESQSEADLSQSGFAPDVLNAAIFFVETSDSFQTALNRSIRFAGGANYCPVLVGSIAGARWGARQIGDDLLRHHNNDLVTQLRSVAADLAIYWTEC